MCKALDKDSKAAYNIKQMVSAIVARESMKRGNDGTHTSPFAKASSLS
jgi:hypothetical protein